MYYIRKKVFIERKNRLMKNIKGKTNREKHILTLLSQKGSVKISDLAKELLVSRETIRRDLMDLEKKNMLQCIYGGAIANTPANIHYQINDAYIKCVEEKNAVAKKAAELIQDYEVVVILASTTTERIGPYLSEKNWLTVITNSIAIANYASQNQTNSVIMLGGDYDNTHKATLGHSAADALASYRADKLFFSSSGVSVAYGITEYYEQYMLVIQAALSIAKTSILLCDYTKYGTIGLHHVCNVSDLDMIIFDSNLVPKKIATLSKENAQIIIADPASNVAPPHTLPAL